MEKKQGEKNFSLDQLDSLLVSTRKDNSGEKLRKVAKKLLNSENYMNFFIKTYKYHAEFDYNMEECFLIKKDLKANFNYVKRIIFCLEDLKLGKLIKKKKGRKNIMFFGLRNRKEIDKIIEFCLKQGEKI